MAPRITELPHTIESVYDNIFTVFAQRHRPLSFQLQQEANPLASAAATARRLEDLAAFEGPALAETIADIRRAVPTLGPLLPPLHVSGRDRSVGQSVRVPTTRIRYRIRVFGDETMLTFWPDEVDADLTAVNQGLVDEIGPEELASEEDAQRYYDSIDWWTLGTARDSPGEPVMALTTYVDLTQEELGHPEKQREVRDLFAQRHAEAEQIVAAIGRQMTKFYEVDLPEALRVRAGWSRARLNNIADINRTIGLPAGWAMEAPRAVEVADPVVVEVAGPGNRLDSPALALGAHKLREHPANRSRLGERRRGPSAGLLVADGGPRERSVARDAPCRHPRSQQGVLHTRWQGRYSYRR